MLAWETHCCNFTGFSINLLDVYNYFFMMIFFCNWSHIILEALIKTNRNRNSFNTLYQLVSFHQWGNQPVLFLLSRVWFNVISYFLIKNKKLHQRLTILSVMYKICLNNNDNEIGKFSNNLLNLTYWLPFIWKH